MVKKVIAILLVAPVALLGVGAIKYDELGLRRYLGFAPDLVVEILLAFVGLCLLGLANYLWMANPAKDAAKPAKAASTERPCPHCGGPVRADAVLCRHCLESLSPGGR